MTHDNIRNGLWAPEVNRREAIRDSAAEYKKVQDVVDALRAAQVNRKAPRGGNGTLLAGWRPPRGLRPSFGSPTGTSGF